MTHDPFPGRAGAPTKGRHLCERCGSEMIEHHCKIRCPNCGYVRDCSDPRAWRPAAPPARPPSARF